MARSHIAVLLGAALFVSILIGQLLASLGYSHTDAWHSKLDQNYHGTRQKHEYLGKQNQGRADDSSSYLLGVGKADITG